jgi:hypothetical protein
LAISWIAVLGVVWFCPRLIGVRLDGTCSAVFWVCSKLAEITFLLLLQTSIITEGFRSLGEGEEVEFYVETGDDGRTKAVQVTGPNGAPPVVR